MVISLNQFHSCLNAERRAGKISHAAEFFLDRYPFLDANNSLWCRGVVEKENYFDKFKQQRAEARKQVVKDFLHFYWLAIRFRLVSENVTCEESFEEYEKYFAQFRQLAMPPDYEADYLDIDTTPLRVALSGYVKESTHSFDTWKISRRNTLATLLQSEGIESMDQLLTAFLDYTPNQGDVKEHTYNFLHHNLGLNKRDSHFVKSKLIKYMTLIDEALNPEEE